MPPSDDSDGSPRTKYVASVCGRFTSLTPPGELAQLFQTEPASDDVAGFAPSYNVAPTTRILAVAVDREGRRRLGRFQWGLVPSWAKDSSGSARLVNARSETVFDKPSFRHLVPSRRCIVPMDGFYEWRTVYEAPRPAKAPKEPVYITRRDGRPLAVAGLWSSWRADGDAPWLHTCCVLTTDANAAIDPIHDRMPVILEEEDWSTWLDPTLSDRAELTAFMVPAPDEVIDVRPVSTRVNSVRNNEPSLLDRID